MNTNIKYCYVCKNYKSINLFGKNKSKKDGLSDECKDCKKKTDKKYKINNKEHISSTGKKYYLLNKEKITNYTKIYAIENKEKLAISRHQYYENNKLELLTAQNLREKERRNTDPNFKLRRSVSLHIRLNLKLNNTSKNGQSCIKYLSYTIQELKIHIENLFEPWMTWSNYGKYIAKNWNDNDPTTWVWQLDHIIPHSTFNYISMDCQEFIDCWALSNLRPYSAKQNLLDGNRR